MNFKHKIFTLALFLFFPFVSSAQTVELSGTEVLYTSVDSTYGVYVYDVGGDFWSHSRLTSQGDNGDFDFTGSSVLVQDAYRTSKQYQFYIDNTTTNFSTYIAQGDPLADLSDPSSIGTFEASFYAEVDGSGNWTCVSPLETYGTCSAPESEATTTAYVTPVYVLTLPATTTCSGSPTSSICVHTYATSTSPYPDYTSQYNYFLVLVSLLTFACGIVGFRSISKKFL